MYAVRMTPLDRPNDGMDIPGFSTPRDAWNELLTQLEQDQGDYTARDIVHGQYQTAIDAVLSMNLNLPGEIKVGSEYKYKVLATS